MLEEEQKWRKKEIARAKKLYRKAVKKIKGKKGGKLVGKKKAQMEELEAKGPLVNAGMASDEDWLAGLKSGIVERKQKRERGRKARSVLTPAVRAAAEAMARGQAVGHGVVAMLLVEAMVGCVEEGTGFVLQGIDVEGEEWGNRLRAAAKAFVIGRTRYQKWAAKRDKERSLSRARAVIEANRGVLAPGRARIAFGAAERALLQETM